VSEDVWHYVPVVGSAVAVCVGRLNPSHSNGGCGRSSRARRAWALRPVRRATVRSEDRKVRQLGK